MAWILVPSKTKTEPVEGGEVVERLCGGCGQDAELVEHRGPRGQSFMKCSACGALFRTSDEPAGASALDSAVDSAAPVLSRASEVAMEALGAVGPLARKAGETLGRIKDRIVSGDEPEIDDDEPTMSDDDPTISDDDPIKADLLRRFAELEKRTKHKRED